MPLSSNLAIEIMVQSEFYRIVGIGDASVRMTATKDGMRRRECEQSGLGEGSN
jgi:hypothetical protein